MLCRTKVHVIYQDHRSLVILKADLFTKLSFPIDLHIKKVCTNIHWYFPQLSRITPEVQKAILFWAGNTRFQKILWVETLLKCMELFDRLGFTRCYIESVSWQHSLQVCVNYIFFIYQLWYNVSKCIKMYRSYRP